MKIKPTFFLFTLTAIFSLTITACAHADDTATSNGDNLQPGADDAQISGVNRLVLGTFMLEETDLAVTAEQADELVTLWQAYQALGNSETTASAELEAIVKQIEKTMTSEQLQEIDEMEINRESMSELMQSLGIDFGARMNGRAQGTPESGQDFSGRGGGMPGGDGNMPPGEGGGMPGGGGGGMPGGGEGFGPQGNFDEGTMDPSMRETAQAQLGDRANQVNPILLSALIEMLESK